MAEKDFSLKIGADISELTSALTEAKEAVVETAESMKEAMAGVSETFASVGEAAVAFTAVLAGGEAFKEVVDSMVRLNVEAAGLGRQFGISATQAAVLKEALNATHVSQDTFSAAGARIVRTLNTNEQAFRNLGVATRDANGNLLPIADIILATNTALLQFKEGTDRNVEAQKIYGKSFLDILPILKLTDEAMKEAKKTSEELGYTVTQQSEAMTNEYRNALNGVSEVMERLEGTIAQAVMPSLTAMAEWFRSVGPQVLEVFRASVQALSSTLTSLGEAVKITWDGVISVFSSFGAFIPESLRPSIGALETFKNVLKVLEVTAIEFRAAIDIMVRTVVGLLANLVDTLRLFADVAMAAFTLNWSNVEAAWNNGLKRMYDDVANTGHQIVEIMEKSGRDANAAFLEGLGKATGTPTPEPKNGNHGTPGGGGGDDKSLDERRALLEKMFRADSEYIDKLREAQEQSYKAQEAEFSKAAGARIAIAEQEVALEEAAFGKGSPQYEAAQKHLIEIKQQANEQLRQMADEFAKQEQDRQLQEIELDEKVLEDKLSHHQISNAQFEAQEIALENRRTAILENGIRERMQLIDPTRDPVAYAKLNAQIEQLEQQHQSKLTQIKQKAAIQDQQLEANLYKTIQSQFTENITKMLEGTETFSQGMRSIFKSILNDIIQFLVQWGVEHAAQMVENLLETKTSAQGQVQSQAGVAGAAGVASFAGAPWPIDVGAPGFGASMAIAAQSFGSIASAAEGYDIPARQNPRVQLHEQEMVLPSNLAKGIRDMVSAGGRGGGGAATFNIIANDAASFRNMLRQKGDLPKLLRNLHQRGHRG